MSGALPKLISVVGTNASGKSSLAISLARSLGGEVISADSRQVYRGLDLGSGKVTAEETQGVPHHLLDVCDPGTFFTMADFQRLAYRAIDDVLARGRVPVLAGGTGLYVDAVAEGYELSATEDCAGTLRADWRQGNPSQEERLEDVEALLAEGGQAPERLILKNLGKTYAPEGTVAELEHSFGLDAAGIAAAVREVRRHEQ